MCGRREPRVVLLVAALACGGCASAHAPAVYQQRPETLLSSAYGGWISLDSGGEPPRVLASGELLAIQGDSVFVLADSTLFALAISEAHGGRFEAFQPDYGGVATWTVLGTLGSLSHGVGWVLTGPLWIILGTVATANVSRSGNLDVPTTRQASWGDLAKFARFPQGLPPELDRASLRRRAPPH